MAYDIITHGVEKYIDQIQSLGDKHRDTLGFLPAGSFKEYADTGSLFCAVNQGQVIAYVLFRYRKRSNSILLVHVCVSSEIQHKGIGAELINTIIEQFPHAYYIEARCRRDYNIDGFWKNAGFNVRQEQSGRKITGSILTVWRRTIVKEDLLDILLQQESEDKIIAVLDANIVISLCDDQSPSVQCLLDEKIHDNVIYCVTPELANELNKKGDDEIRVKHLSFSSRFQRLNSTGLDKETLQFISQNTDPKNTHMADLRHITYCIQSGNVEAFVTNDEWIVSHRDFFSSEFNLLIFYPEEFWQYAFSYDYHDIVNTRIIGSKYKFGKLDNTSLKAALDLHQTANMKKSAWNVELRRCMIDTSTHTWLLMEDERVIGLISIKQNPLYSSIARLELNKKENLKVYRFLIKAMIEKAIIFTSAMLNDVNREVSVLFISQTSSQEIKTSLLENGFIELEAGFVRFILRGVHSRGEIFAAMDEYIELLQGNKAQTCEFIIEQLMDIVSELKSVQGDSLERFCSPVIISDLEIPSYIISIDPKYAINLFDEELANANISFLENPYIYAALSSLNAYYTKSQIRFQTPCRLFWYIKQDRNYEYSGAVRACSIMISHQYGSTKELFKRYGQFGVLEWQDVKDKDSIGVFTFSNTVLFSKPISYATLTKIASDCQETKVQLQGPYHMSEALSQKLLFQGMR